MGAAEALGGSIHDRLEYTLRVAIQLVVPDTQDCPAFAPEEFVATPVGLGLGMLAAVQLDDQLGLPACEIGIIRSDRQLTREFRTQTRQYPPKFALVLGRIVAQRSSALRSFVLNPTAHVPNLTAMRASRTHP